jgi:protein ImuA
VASVRAEKPINGLPAHLAALRDNIRPPRFGVLAFGDPRIDAHLPGGGLALGQLHEIGGIGVDTETGALPAGFAAALAGRIGTGRIGAQKPVFWIATHTDLYPHALSSFGLDPGRLVLVRADDSDATLAAMETALREGGADVVVGEVETLGRVASRRLALACQRHGTTCLALRRWPYGRRTEDRDTSLATTRWRLSPVPSEREGREPGPPRWLLGLTQARGGRPGEWIVQAGESEDATHPVRVVALLANSPLAARSALAG